MRGSHFIILSLTIMTLFVFSDQTVQAGPLAEAVKKAKAAAGVQDEGIAGKQVAGKQVAGKQVAAEQGVPRNPVQPVKVLPASRMVLGVQGSHRLALRYVCRLLAAVTRCSRSYSATA